MDSFAALDRKDGAPRSDEKYAVDVFEYKPTQGEHNTIRGRTVDAAKILDQTDLHVTDEERKQVLRRIDMFCLPLMGLVFIQTFLDRVCINYARLLNWQHDLSNMSNNQYSWLSSGLSLCMLVSSPLQLYLMQKFPWGTGKFIALNMFFWGITLALHAACFSYADMLIARCWIGFFTASISPGFRRFYSGREIATRTTIWFTTMNGLAQVIGSLLSYGLLRQHEGKLARWRECFIILGGICILTSVLVWFFLPSQPNDAWFLNERQRLVAVDRVRLNETGIGEPEWKWYQVKEAVLDARLYIMCICVGVLAVADGGVLAYGSVIIQSLGYGVQKTALLGMCTGWAEVGAMIFFVIVQHFTCPSVSAALSMFISIAGAGLLVSDASPAARFAGYCIVFFYPTLYLVLFATLSGSISGHTKFTIFNICFQIMTQVGNICGPQSWQAKQAPEFTAAKATMLSMLVAADILFCSLFVYHWFENKRRDRIYGKPSENVHTAADDLSDQTDKEKAPFFRYPM